MNRRPKSFPVIHELIHSGKNAVQAKIINIIIFMYQLMDKVKPNKIKTFWVFLCLINILIMMCKTIDYAFIKCVETASGHPECTRQ